MDSPAAIPAGVVDSPQGAWLLGLLIVALLAEGAFRLLGRTRLLRAPSLSGQIGYRILMGTATIPWLCMFLDRARIPIDRVSLLIAAAALALTGLAILRPVRGCWTISRAGSELRSGLASLLHAPAGLILTIAAAAVPILSFMHVSQVPPWAYDAMVGYDLVGKIMAVEGRLISSVFEVIQFNAQCVYAPFTATNQGYWYLFASSMPKLWMPILTAGFLLVLWSRVRTWTGSVTAAGIVTFLLHSPPELNFHLHVGQTDYPSMVFTSLAMLALVDDLREGRGFRETALLTCLATTTRTENVLFAFALAVVAFCFNRGRRWRALHILWPSIAFFCLWNLYFVRVLMNYDPAQHFRPALELDFGRLMEVLRNAHRIVFSIGALGELPYLFPLTALLWAAGLTITRARRRSWNLESPRITGLLMLIMLVCFACYIPYFYQWDPHLNPLDTMEHTFKRGFFRFIPVILVAFTCTPIVLRALRTCERS